MLFILPVFSHLFLLGWRHFEFARRRVFSTNRLQVMGGEQAAGVLATVKREQIERRGQAWSAAEEAAFKQPILDK